MDNNIYDVVSGQKCRSKKYVKSEIQKYEKFENIRDCGLVTPLRGHMFCPTTGGIPKGFGLRVGMEPAGLYFDHEFYVFL